MSEYNLPPVQPVPTGAPAKEIKVVGMTKDERIKPYYPAFVHKMQAWIDCGAAQQLGGEFIAGVLVREPDNRFDPNAIQVHCPAMDMLVGYIPATEAVWLAPMMDGGARYMVDLWPRIDPAHPNNPGVTVRLRAVGQ